MQANGSVEEDARGAQEANGDEAHDDEIKHCKINDPVIFHSISYFL